MTASCLLFSKPTHPLAYGDGAEIYALLEAPPRLLDIFPHFFTAHVKAG